MRNNAPVSYDKGFTELDTRYGSLDYSKVGTGAPNGVVVGDVGDRYIDTVATVGARVWYKASGDGTNTGWLVAEGDTGWRAVIEWNSAGVITGDALGTGWIPRPGVAGGIFRRRLNNMCFIHVAHLQAGVANPSGYVDGIRTGFGSGLGGRYHIEPISSTSSATIEGGGGRFNMTATSGTIFTGQLFSYPTIEAWPTSLPGLAD